MRKCKDKNRKIGQKISLIRTVSVLLFLFYTFTLGLGFYSVFHFVNKAEINVREERIVRADQKLKELERDLDNYHSQVKTMFQRGNGDYYFSSNNELELLLAKRNLMSDFVNCMAQFPSIKLIFYSDDTNGIHLYNSNCIVSEIPILERLRQKDVLEVVSYYDTYWKYLEYEGYRYLYLVNQNGNARMGIVVNVDSLIEECRTLLISDNEAYAVYYEGKPVICGEYSPDSSIGKTMEHEIFKRKFSCADLFFAYYYESDTMEEFIDDSVIVSVIFVILELIFCVLGYLVLAKYLVKPINSITHVMKEVELGDYQIRADLDAVNSIETTQLATTLNHMLDEVVNLRLESYEQSLREQSDRLRMLRSQLRPHFYLNAINTINSMTYQEDNAERIREYLYALSTHMRYMMRLDVNTVSLADELSNVEAYIKLQEFRGECTYNYYIDCDDELKLVRVPYLILYTFIENVFKYGIKTKDSFFVMIECHKGTLSDGTPVAVLSVEDNGSGFSEDILEEFRKGELHQTDDGHIGLINIMKTLELMYNRKNMMNIENTLTGARVEVRIIDESING